MPDWIDVCAADEIDDEDMMRFDHAGRTYALYQSHEGAFYCTDGLCTHEQAHLAGGLVAGHVVECPRHDGRFDYRTGEALGGAACVNLGTYPVRVDGGRVFVAL